MKKWFWFFVFLFALYMVYKAVMYTPTASPMDHLTVMSANTQSAARQVVHSSPAPAATETPNPTATIGYQATAEIAQKAALDAQALANSAVQTADNLKQMHIDATVTSDALTAQVDRWTAEAPATPTPDLMATRTQVAFNIAVLGVQSGQLTATVEAPTQVVAMSIAKAQADNADFGEKMRIISPIIISLIIAVMVIGLVIFLRQPKNVETVSASSANDEATRHFGTVVTMRNEENTIAGRVVVPCNIDQLDALADGLINGGLTLAFKSWCGEGKPFTRDTSFPMMRTFLMENRMTLSTGQGNLVLTPDGEAFFRGWVEQGKLPRRYVVTNDSGIISGENTHVRAPHTRADGGGGGLQPLPQVN